MRIAVIGGGASGMVSAYYLDKQGHHVTVYERQPTLGGHIQTLNKNVRPNQQDCPEILECGVLEFPGVFHNFIALMRELDVYLVPVQIGSALFPQHGQHFLSEVAIERNFTGIQRLIEYLRFDAVHVLSAGLWLKTMLADQDDFADRSLADYLRDDSTASLWLKLLTMYSYSMPLEIIDNFPSELAIPALRDYLAVHWFRIEGGVYTYIEKILERFRGKVCLNAQIVSIARTPSDVRIDLANGETRSFDKIVFATAPDQVLTMLMDPSPAETKRFSAWKANYATTVVHGDTAMYDKQGIRHPTEFDFFQSNTSWGYNCCLNHLCGISSAQKYFLSFQLEELIAPESIIHKQLHHTPLYTTESFRYWHEIIATNGENNTYYAGAYLGDGLHEGAVTSALHVAKLIGRAKS